MVVNLVLVVMPDAIHTINNSKTHSKIRNHLQKYFYNSCCDSCASNCTSCVGSCTGSCNSGCTGSCASCTSCLKCNGYCNSCTYCYGCNDELTCKFSCDESFSGSVPPGKCESKCNICISGCYDCNAVDSWCKGITAISGSCQAGNGDQCTSYA